MLNIHLETTSERFGKDNSNLLSLFSFQGQKEEANLYRIFRHLAKTEGVLDLTRYFHLG